MISANLPTAAYDPTSHDPDQRDEMVVVGNRFLEAYSSKEKIAVLDGTSVRELLLDLHVVMGHLIEFDGTRSTQSGSAAKSKAGNTFKQKGRARRAEHRRLGNKKGYLTEIPVLLPTGT